MTNAKLSLNDRHSRLNPTQVQSIVAVGSIEDARREIIAAGANRQSVCIGGGRHAMGGQQFAREVFGESDYRPGVAG